MQYNLLEYSCISVSGSVSLTFEDIEKMISINGNITISGTHNDILWVDCDLGDRIVINQIRYYFNSSTASGTVASGVMFYYKNDVVDR